MLPHVVTLHSYAYKYKRQGIYSQDVWKVGNN